MTDGKRPPKTGAERQRAYRERHDLLVRNVRALLATIADGTERARCHHITDRLPEDANAAVVELNERLTGKRLMITTRERRPKSGPQEPA